MQAGVPAYIAVGYYVPLVILGGFLVINLFLAVVFEEFSCTQVSDDDSRTDEHHALLAQALHTLPYYTYLKHVQRRKVRPSASAQWSCDSIAPPSSCASRLHAACLQTLTAIARWSLRSTASE